jgi:membrane-associated phospholipid phosphatase
VVARKAKRATMLLWAGAVFLVLGMGSLAIDRQAAHLFYDHIKGPFFRFLLRTTHWAKGGHWLTAAIVGYFGSQIVIHFFPKNTWVHVITKTSFAFIACLAVGSAVLHAIKRIFARRRPRDEMEMGLYGFVPFSFKPMFDSFPSGHALTIVTVAAIASCLWPQLALLWFVVALWLAFTRAFITSHFLSDVFVGSGIALIAARETLLIFFPGFTPGWF